MLRPETREEVLPTADDAARLARGIHEALSALSGLPAEDLARLLTDEDEARISTLMDQFKILADYWYARKQGADAEVAAIFAVMEHQ